MSRVSPGLYYVPGRERPRRSLISRMWFPVLSLLMLAGSVYCGYVYRTAMTAKTPLANAAAIDTGPSSPTKTPKVATVSVVTPPVQEQPLDISAVITRNGLDQNRAQIWSVAVYDIKNNRWLGEVNPNQQLFSASLYKLYVTYALSKKISFDQWDNKQVAGHSLKSCVDLMLRVSDNTCGLAVGQLVGWNNVDKISKQYGFTDTIMNKPGGSVTTAGDTATFMSDLYQGKLFDQDTTAFVLSSLKNQVYRSGIPAGCTGCTVYNKTGNEGTDNHDAAIVQSGNNTYAVAILSEGSSMGRIANVEKAIEAALKSAQP